MSKRPNKLYQFWQELKRRRVINVITVYASVAWVLIQLINNLIQPLNLPAGLATIVVIVLAVGFPLVIILSWIYDLTSEGIEKTKPLSEIYDKEKTVLPNAWKIATYVSFVVIIGLVTYNIFKGSSGLRSGDIQSLAILPFDNFTGDEQLDYVAAGMHASLTFDAQKISSLRVISKTSTSIYKKLNMSLPQIATELNVEAIVEPTVTCYGDSVCIQIRLITLLPEEKQIWMAEYKEEKSQIMNLYNRITKQIANEVRVVLTPGEEHLLAETKTINTEAYDAYLRGMYHWDQFTPESLQLAVEFFNKATEIDPDWAPPYAGIAYYWIAIRQYGIAPPSITMPRIYSNIEKAFKLEPNSEITQYVSALASVWTEFDWEKGEKEFLKVLEINPNDAFTHVYYAHLLMTLKRDDEAIVQCNLALDLDPINPMLLGLAGMVLGYTGENDRAIEVSKKALSLAPGNSTALTALYTGYLGKKKYIKAFDYWMKTLPIDDMTKLAILKSCEEEGYIAAANKFAEEYGKSSNILPFDIAQIYTVANKPSKALDWFEKAYENHDANTPYIGLNWFSKGTFKIDDPRFIELHKKMNLPYITSD